MSNSKESLENGSSLFPTYARYPIALVKGEGSRLWDDQGKEYIDFMSGLAVTNLGHAPKRVADKIKEQLDTLWHVSNLFHIPQQEVAAKLLTEHSCADAVFFCNSGAEANEAAIKLARRYNQKILGNDRYEIITFHQSFHGRTLATLTATGQAKVQEGFKPLPAGFKYVPFNDADSLKAAIGEHTCAVMLEIVQAEGGVHPIEPAFAEAVTQLCKEHGLLLIIDEVQTGMGRTGRWFAHEHYGLQPDIFTVAKGLGSGFPVGAMLAKGALREAFNAGSHGSTFGGTPLAMAAVIGTLETHIEEKLADRAADVGTYLIAQLHDKIGSLPIVNEIRGIGLLIGIECKQPVAEFVSTAQEQGLLFVTAGPNVIRLLPNLLVTKDDVDQVAGMLYSLLQAAVVPAM